MSQPGPPGDWPDGSGSGSGHRSAEPATMYPGPPDRPDGGGRVAARRPRFAVFAVVLVVGLAGLAVAAVGIAHALLPRQLTAAQRRQISDWEMERRWRALPAGKIFPASVSYTVPAADLYSGSGLTLHAQRLAISRPEGCAGAFDAAAGRVPGPTAANAAYARLPGTAAGAPGPAHAFAVAGTPAAGFGDAERQLSIDVA